MECPFLPVPRLYFLTAKTAGYPRITEFGEVSLLRILGSVHQRSFVQSRRPAAGCSSSCGLCTKYSICCQVSFWIQKFGQSCSGTLVGRFLRTLPG